MKTYIKFAALAATISTLGTLSTLSPSASAQMRPQPVMQIVSFRADWCGPCKIMEPNLAQALRTLNDPSLQLVTIDTTNGRTSEAAAYVAFDANIAQQYNQWLGITGFAVMIDADTKNTLGCVNMTYSADMMATHIANLKQLALSNTPNYDITCPAPNNR
jgi:thiol-disulfide isomerase/thioredoxin